MKCIKQFLLHDRITILIRLTNELNEGKELNNNIQAINVYLNTTILLASALYFCQMRKIDGLFG